MSELNAQQSLKGRIGFGLGYQSGIEFFDFNPMNSELLEQSEKGLSNNLMLGGISGYFYFLILPDTRLSFNYLNAKKESRAVNGFILSFEQTVWNFGIEYTITSWNLNISPGIFLGKVSDFLEMSFYNGTKDFKNLLYNFKTQSSFNGSLNFENNSFHISPSLNFEYSLSRFLAVRVNYFYLIRINKSWKFLRHYTLDNVPSNFVNNNHVINIGLLIGFMSK